MTKPRVTKGQTRKKASPRKKAKKPPPSSRYSLPRTKARQVKGSRKLPAKGSLVDQALKGFEDAIGGRLTLVEALATADLTADQRYIVGLIADPRNDTKSLAKLLGEQDVSVGAFLQTFKEARLAKAQIEAIHAVSDRLGETALDVMARSVSHVATCPVCKGAGELASGEDIRSCPRCEGKRRTEVEPEIERQKLALEIGGLYKRGGSLNVGVAVNNAPTGGRLGQDELRDMRIATDKLLYPGRERGRSTREEPSRAEVVDAEVVEGREERSTKGPVYTVDHLDHPDHVDHPEPTPSSPSQAPSPATATTPRGIPLPVGKKPETLH